jgi:hypothetical protein
LPEAHTIPTQAAAICWLSVLPRLFRSFHGFLVPPIQYQQPGMNVGFHALYKHVEEFHPPDIGFSNCQLMNLFQGSGQIALQD